MNYQKIIAVDFDGCLCTNNWPGIGEPNWKAIWELIRRKSEGDKIILWTCRDGEQLKDAVLWCANHGLQFDSVNENLPENVARFGNNSRKIYATEYWDDKAVRIAADDNKPIIHTSVYRKRKTVFQFIKRCFLSLIRKKRG